METFNVEFSQMLNLWDLPHDETNLYTHIK